MSLSIKVFSLAAFALALLTAYMAVRHDWGRKHYLVARKMKYYPPGYLFTLMGERWYVRMYVLGAVVAVLATAILCVVAFVYL